ncbi:MAG: hypothetical protein M0Q51_03965 [Bacteroidales bacterium]|nr:hypothetical protein [Bacteroidales bacterium]
MKKLLIILAFLGLLAFGTSNVSEAAPAPVPDCFTVIITCSNGSQHYLLVCDWEDLVQGYEVLCGAIN